MPLTLVIVLLFGIKPLTTYGAAAWGALQSQDYFAFKANLLFFTLTCIVVIGLSYLGYK